MDLGISLITDLSALAQQLEGVKLESKPEAQPGTVQLFRNGANFGPLPTGPLVDQIGIQGEERRIEHEEERRRAARALKSRPPFRSVAELHNAYLGAAVAIVGGGPSLEDTLPELLGLVAAGAQVIAVNRTHDWLIDRGLVPTFGIMCDPKEFVAAYQTPTEGVRYLLASRLHDDTLARFSGNPAAYLWHAMPDMPFREWLLGLAQQERQSVVGFEGGGTTGLRAIEAATFLGFRKQHLFAFDSSAENDKLYSYEKPVLDPIGMSLQLIDPHTNQPLPQRYPTSVPMAHQAMQFELIMRSRSRQIREGTYPPIDITVHGRGLIPDWAALNGMHHDPGRGDMLRATTETLKQEPDKCQDLSTLQSLKLEQYAVTSAT